MVVGTCPDLGAIQPIQPPLRWLARRWSRQLAAAQTVAVVEAGGWTVSLGDLLGPRFAAEPTRMFAADRFHPSAEGYAVAAAAMLPTVLRGARRRRRVAAGPLTAGEGVRSLPQAAQRGRAGTPAPRSAASRWAAATAVRRAGGRSCAVARQRGSRPVRWVPGGCWERDAPARPYPWISPVPTRWRCRRNRAKRGS